MKKFIPFLTLACILSVNVQAFTPEITTFTKMNDPADNYFQWPEKGRLIWGDYNNDGYLDAFLISGGWSILYVNENGALRGIDPGTGGLKQASAAFIDYNNDGNLDLIFTGRDGDSGPFMTRLYTNTGAPAYTFVQDTRSLFEGVYAEDHPTRLLSVADFNNDGWPDILINGAGNGRILKLYKNDHGVFTEVTRPVDGTETFPALNGGSAAWDDIDRDGYMDFVVSGYGNGAETWVFRNNGNETFSLLAKLNGQYDGETTLLDIDNDGYPDIIESGYASAYQTRIYLNNRDNTFTQIVADLPVAERLLAVTYGDFNNDGWVDMAESYNNAGWTPFTDIYYNNGDTTFTRQADALVNVRSAFISSADINNDGNLDIYVGGYGNGYQWGFFTNDTETEYQAPSVPQNLTAVFRGDTLELGWDKSVDTKMPQEAIVYNIFVQKGDQYNYALVPADPETGRLKIGDPQPYIRNNAYRIHGLADGTYTVGIQAVNHSRRASAFTTASVTKSPVGLASSVSDNLTIRKAGSKIRITNRTGETARYMLTSINGQTLSAGDCPAGNDLTLSAPAGGIYIVRCITRNRSFTSKIIL